MFHPPRPFSLRPPPGGVRVPFPTPQPSGLFGAGVVPDHTEGHLPYSSLFIVPAALPAKGGASSVSEDPRKVLADRFKTRPCANYEATGACPYAHRCMFAHGPHEARTAEENVRDGLFTEEAIKAFRQAEQKRRKRKKDTARRRAKGKAASASLMACEESSDEGCDLQTVAEEAYGATRTITADGSLAEGYAAGRSLNKEAFANRNSLTAMHQHHNHHPSSTTAAAAADGYSRHRSASISSLASADAFGSSPFSPVPAVGVLPAVVDEGASASLSLAPFGQTLLQPTAVFSGGGCCGGTVRGVADTSEVDDADEGICGCGPDCKCGCDCGGCCDPAAAPVVAECSGGGCGGDCGVADGGEDAATSLLGGHERGNATETKLGLLVGLDGPCGGVVSRKAAGGCCNSAGGSWADLTAAIAAEAEAASTAGNVGEPDAEAILGRVSGRKGGCCGASPSSPSPTALLAARDYAATPTFVPDALRFVADGKEGAANNIAGEEEAARGSGVTSDTANKRRVRFVCACPSSSRRAFPWGGGGSSAALSSVFGNASLHCNASITSVATNASSDAAFAIRHPFVLPHGVHVSESQFV